MGYDDFIKLPCTDCYAKKALLIFEDYKEPASDLRRLTFRKHQVLKANHICCLQLIQYIYRNGEVLETESPRAVKYTF